MDGTRDEDGPSKAFEAFGQSFLAQFGPMPAARGGKRKAEESQNHKRKKRKLDTPPPQEKEDSGSSADRSSSESDASEENLFDDGYNGADENIVLDRAPEVPVIVFGEEKIQKVDRQSKKGFMSSKISKIRKADEGSAPQTKKEKVDEEEARANDRTLHKLIHTKLLSASLDERSSDMNGAKKKKSIEGRVLELSTSAKIGKGERRIRKMEHVKAPRHIREGIVAKQQEKSRQRLEEAKNLGNYHPTIKHLLADSDQPLKHNKRERGIGMGVGKFRGGVLTLGKREIDKGQGPSQSSDFRKRRGSKRR